MEEKKKKKKKDRNVAKMETLRKADAKPGSTSRPVFSCARKMGSSLTTHLHDMIDDIFAR